MPATLWTYLLFSHLLNFFSCAPYIFFFMGYRANGSHLYSSYMSGTYASPTYFPYTSAAATNGQNPYSRHHSGYYAYGGMIVLRLMKKIMYN